MSKADYDLASQEDTNTPNETVEATTQEEPQAETQSSRSGKGSKRKKNRKKEDIQQDDDFGNRIDYVPQNGLGGVYREPMQGGTQWGYNRNRRNHRNHRRNRHHQQQHQEQEGVLSIRQTAWKERIQSSENNFEQQQSGVLTIRQQGNLARSLRWGQKEQHTYISKPGSNKRRDDRRNGRNDESGRSTQKNNRSRRNRSNHRGKR